MPPYKDPDEDEEQKKVILQILEENMKVNDESTQVISEKAKLE